MGRAILITGTDTAVGKTIITAGLVKALNQKGIKTIGVKPFACGAVKKNDKWIYEDIEMLKTANAKKVTVTKSDSHFLNCHCLMWKPPLAPYRASLLEKKPIDFKKIHRWLETLKKQADLILIEGVGGLLCPLTCKLTLADWAKKEKLLLILVARLSLGTLNHTLMTVEAARHRGLKIKGIILNDHPKTKSDLSRRWNPEDLRRLTGVPILGTFPYLKKPSPDRAARALRKIKLNAV